MRDFHKLFERLAQIATIVACIAALIGLYLDRSNWPFQGGNNELPILTVTNQISTPETIAQTESISEVFIASTATLHAVVNTTGFPLSSDAAGIPLRDDFNDAKLDGWKTEGGGNVLLTDGVLEIQADSQTTAYAGEEYWHNYSVSISIMATVVQSKTAYGVVVRKSDSCQLYYLRLTPSDENQSQILIELLKYFECSQNNVYVLGRNLVNTSATSWHNVYLAIHGDSNSNIKVWIDGEEVLNFTDSQSFIYSGSIGLRAEDSTIYFDNLMVDPIN